jgi:hypothetical protein
LPEIGQGEGATGAIEARFDLSMPDDCTNFDQSAATPPISGYLDGPPVRSMRLG